MTTTDSPKIVSIAAADPNCKILVLDRSVQTERRLPVVCWALDDDGDLLPFVHDDQQREFPRLLRRTDPNLHFLRVVYDNELR